jgi:hypothetical protein
MTTSNLGVRTPHRDYLRMSPKWKKIRDVLSAEVKEYLRNVGASESDPVYAAKRQADYEDGAVFYGFVDRTLKGMVGGVTRKPPEVILDTQLDYLLKNTNGAGIGLVQQSQDALKEVDSLGRAGLLTDSPETAAANRAQQNAGLLNPRILLYTAENIISWRKARVGSTEVLTQVVLRESYEYQNELNEFDYLIGEQFRVLEIVDGKYQQRLFKFDYSGSQVGVPELILPTIGKKSIGYIPFSFIGSDNNDDTIDEPPLFTLTEINLGHFRNSADVEESAFICSQPTLMLYPGEQMNSNQFAEANKNGIRLGSRMGHNLGAGGGSELLQASPSNLSKELMAMKEEQAVKAGAQLITPSVQMTAEAARLQRGADTSIMATIAINVSMAYKQNIIWCGEMLGIKAEDTVFELNMEFFMAQMTAQDRTAWMVDINAGLLPARSYYAALRAAGVTNWTDEDIESEIEKQPPAPSPALNAAVTGEIPDAPMDNQDA